MSHDVWLKTCMQLVNETHFLQNGQNIVMVAFLIYMQLVIKEYFGW